MEIKILLILIVTSIVLYATVLLVREYLKTQNRLSDVEKENNTLNQKVNELDERMKKLEEANRKRMPYEAFESILDARAALNRFREENKFFDELVENAEAHLSKAMATGTKREEEK